MDASTDTQTWPEVTGNAIGKDDKLPWTQVHQGKDVYLEMARQHCGQKSQAPTYKLKVNDLVTGLFGLINFRPNLFGLAAMAMALSHGP